MYSRTDKLCLLVAVLFVLSFLGVSFKSYMTQPLTGDEHVFIKITENLPSYESHKVWVEEWIGYEESVPDAYYDVAFETPFWWHPPVANYVAYLIVRTNVRAAAWLMLLLCVLAVFYKTRRNVLSLLFTAVPLLAAIPLLLYHSNWFYHDTFMLFFLTAALLIRGTRHERWIYVPLALMVGCKIYAIVFLIPFIIENRKTALCSLVLVPYFIQGYIVMGNFGFFTEHWSKLRELDVGWFGEPVSIVAAHMCRSLLLVMIIPVMWCIKEREQLFLLLLFGISTIVALSWGGFAYQMMPAVIVSSLLCGNWRYEDFIRWKRQRSTT